MKYHMTSLNFIGLVFTLLSKAPIVSFLSAQISEFYHPDSKRLLLYSSHLRRFIALTFTSLNKTPIASVTNIRDCSSSTICPLIPLMRSPLHSIDLCIIGQDAHFIYESETESPKREIWNILYQTSSDTILQIDQKSFIDLL